MNIIIKSNKELKWKYEKSQEGNKKKENFVSFGNIYFLTKIWKYDPWNIVDLC